MRSPVVKDHLNPNRVNPEERINSEERAGYGEWQVLLVDYGPFDPYLANYDLYEDELVDTVSYTEGQIGRLRKWYEFKDRVAVEDFLRENLFLLDSLENAYDKIHKYFGSDTTLAALKVVEEPDAENGDRLFVLIYTALRPREAVARLDELDREWWLGELAATRGKLSIDLEYG